jgi:hypothetical protein
MATPCAAAASVTRSMSNATGSREPIRRPVGCPNACTHGFDTARSARSVATSGD